MNKKQIQILKKIVLLTNCLVLCCQTLLPISLSIAHAEEPTPSPEVTITETPTPTTSIPEPTITAIPTIEPLTSTPTTTIVPTETPSPTLTSTPTPTPTLDNAPQPTIDPTSDASGSSTIEVTTIITDQQDDLDTLNANISQPSASLTTDKDDYAPTETVLIAGENYLPNSNYVLVITSPNDSNFYFEVIITTSANGTIFYSYQLDGVYRPSYKAEVKDESGLVITTVNFTDSRTIQSITLNNSLSVNVQARESINVKVQTSTDWWWWWDDDWNSTSWKIGDGSWNCVNHGDHYDEGSYTESFNVSAPDQTGDYDISLRAYSNDSCTSGQSDIKTLDNAIHVINTDTTPPVCPAPILTSISGPSSQTGNTIYYSSNMGSFKLTTAASDNIAVSKVNFPLINSFSGGGNNDTLPPYEGVYNWYQSSSTNVSGATITCFDQAGNTSTSTFDIKKDSTNPSITSASLDKYAVKQGTNVILTTNVTENDSGIDTCSVYLSNNNNSSSTSGDELVKTIDGSCSDTFAINKNTNQSYFVKLKANDNVGHNSNIYILPTKLVVDNLAPVLTCPNVNVNNQSNQNGAQVSFSGTAIDSRDGSLPITYTPASGTFFSVGTTSVTCEATDSVGNKATKNFNVVVVDSESPTTPGTPTTTNPNSSSKPIWSWSGSTDNSGSVSYKFYWGTNPANLDNVSASQTSTSFTHITSLTNGVWYAKVVASDQAGNTTASSIGSVTIDTQAPSTTITNPSSDQYFKQALTITGNSVDTTGISKVDLYSANFNGENCGTFTLFATLYPEQETNNYSWSYSWSPSEGKYCLKANATDTLHNQEDSSTSISNLIFDYTNPTITFTEDNPQNNLLTNKNTQTFSVSVNEPVSSCTLNFNGNYLERRIDNGLSDGTGFSSIVSGDDSAINYTLPFFFPFYGNSYNHFSISTNSLIDFGSMYNANYPGSVYELSRTIGISTLWTDLVTSVYARQETDAVRFRWAGSGWSTGGYLTNEAVLRNNGQVELHYGNVYLPGRTVTIGLSSGDGSTYSLSSLNGQSSISPISFAYSPGPTNSYVMTQNDDGTYSYTVNDLEDGIINYSVTCSDLAGNDGVSSSRSLTIDTKAPILSTKTVYSGWYNTDQVSEFNYADENGIASGTPVSCTISTEGENQTCSVTPNVCDNADNCNQETVSSNGANIDKTNPDINYVTNPTNPDGNNNWFVTKPEIGFVVIDQNPSLVRYHWDNEDWSTYTTPFSPNSEGEHTLYYQATDLANNSSEIKSAVIKWDQTEISSTGLNITADPNPTSGETSLIKWELVKDNIGIDHYEINWTLNNISDPKTYSASVDSNTKEYKIDKLTEGRWTVNVKAFDPAGHTINNSIDLIVDRTAPQAPTLTMTGSGIGTASLSWNQIPDATDYIVWYGVAPGIHIFGARVGNTTSYTVRGLAAGNYYFIVKAVDASQNQSSDSNEVSTGSIAGAPGAIPGEPAEGFSPEVKGTSTDEPSVSPTPETTGLPQILGQTTSSFSLSNPIFILGLITFLFGLFLLWKKRKEN